MPGLRLPSRRRRRRQASRRAVPTAAARAAAALRATSAGTWPACRARSICGRSATSFALIRPTAWASPGFVVQLADRCGVFRPCVSCVCSWQPDWSPSLRCWRFCSPLRSSCSPGWLAPWDRCSGANQARSAPPDGGDHRRGSHKGDRQAGRALRRRAGRLPGSNAGAILLTAVRQRRDPRAGRRRRRRILS